MERLDGFDPIYDWYHGEDDDVPPPDVCELLHRALTPGGYGRGPLTIVSAEVLRHAIVEIRDLRARLDAAERGG